MEFHYLFECTAAYSLPRFSVSLIGLVIAVVESMHGWCCASRWLLHCLDLAKGFCGLVAISTISDDSEPIFSVRVGIARGQLCLHSRVFDLCARLLFLTSERHLDVIVNFSRFDCFS